MKRLASLMIACCALYSCGGGGGGGGFKPIDPSKIVVETGLPPGTIGAQIQGVGPGEQVGNVDGKGAIYHGDPQVATLLSSPDYQSILAWCTDGTQQGGRGIPISVPNPGVNDEPCHALLWHGSSSSMVVLHPPSYFSSDVLGVSGNQQVGRGRLVEDGPRHPLLWTGTAASVIDLMPSGADYASLTCVRNGVQGGVARMIGAGEDEFHAATWHSTAASFQDHHPAGYYRSGIGDISTRDMVGSAQLYADGNNEFHAMRWTNGNVIDLHPPGKYSSNALASNGRIQVGYFQDTAEGKTKACMWQGSADTFVDLDALLPAGPGYLLSMAQGVVDGVIYGFGYPSNGAESHVVIWRLPQ